MLPLRLWCSSSNRFVCCVAEAVHEKLLSILTSLRRKAMNPRILAIKATKIAAPYEISRVRL